MNVHPSPCVCGHAAALHVPPAGSCTTGAAEHCYGYVPDQAVGADPKSGGRGRYEPAPDPPCAICGQPIGLDRDCTLFPDGTAYHLVCRLQRDRA